MTAQKRNQSQKRNPIDENKLHYMPMVEHKNAWMTKQSVAVEDSAKFSNLIFHHDTNMLDKPTTDEFYTKRGNKIEEVKKPIGRSPMIVHKTDLVLKRNDIRTSSLTRTYRENYQTDPKTQTARYSKYQNYSK